MQVISIPINCLKSNPRNVRTHSRAQVTEIAKSIEAFGFLVPLLIDEENTVLAGHGRLAATTQLDLAEVPVVRVEGLSEAKKRAFMIADNRLAEHAGWDRKQLAIELPELSDVLIAEGLDITVTGFAVAEVDQIVVDFENDSGDPADDVPESFASSTPVSKFGDLWQLGPHRLLCGDARDTVALATLRSRRSRSALRLRHSRESRDDRRRRNPPPGRR